MPKYRAPDEFYDKMGRLARKIERPEETKRFEFPEPPNKVSLLNPVNAVVAGVNNVMNRVVDSPIGKVVNSASERLPYLRERPIVTPFGRIKLPEVRLPELHEVELDARKREVLKAAVGIDASQAVAIVPVVGDIIADTIEDIHQEALRETLNDAEFRAYTKYDKLGPSTLAVARTFMREEGR